MFCLPVAQAQKFIASLKNGEIDPGKLSTMTSDERHEFFSKIVGEDDAKDVNALFESKLLLKNQRAGMVRWAKSVTGITEAARKDIVTQIGKMDKILQPGDEASFLKDLASKKLGASVTVDEAKQITSLSQKAQAARDEMKDTPGYSPERNAYGRAVLDLQKYVEGLKPKDNSWGQWADQILNLPRTALTGVVHLSAPGVQLWGMEGTPHYLEAFGNMFKYFANEDAYKGLSADIIGHPDYKFATDGKLGLTSLGDKLSNREDAIRSSLLEKIPLLGKLPEASGRAFVGTLNYMRFTRFVDLLNAARVSGEDVRIGSQTVKDIANTVNDFTGRGAIPSRMGGNHIAGFLNSIYFSPRKILGTIRMMNPVRYVDPRISKTARLGALRQITGAVVATGAVLELAHLAGAQVGTNPDQPSKFLKITIGNQTINPSGDIPSYIALLTELVKNQTTNSSGKVTKLGAVYGSPTKADEFVQFNENKFAPLASLMSDWLSQSKERPFNAVGEGKGGVVNSELFNKFMPIAIGDFIEMFESSPANPASYIPTLAAVFGLPDTVSQAKK